MSKLRDKKAVMAGTVERAGRVIAAIADAVETNGAELSDEEFAAIWVFLGEKLQATHQAAFLAHKMARARNASFSFDNLPATLASSIVPAAAAAPLVFSPPAPIIFTPTLPVAAGPMPAANGHDDVSDDVLAAIEEGGTHPEAGKSKKELTPEDPEFKSLTVKEKRDLGWVPIGKGIGDQKGEVIWGRPEKPKAEPDDPEDVPHPKHKGIAGAGFIEE